MHLIQIKHNSIYNVDSMDVYNPHTKEMRIVHKLYTSNTMFYVVICLCDKMICPWILIKQITYELAAKCVYSGQKGQKYYYRKQFNVEYAQQVNLFVIYESNVSTSLCLELFLFLLVSSRCQFIDSIIYKSYCTSVAKRCQELFLKKL